MLRRTQAENLALFDREAITVGPVCDAADLTEHPYVSGREVLVEVPDTEAGSLPMHDVVPRLSDTPGTFRRAAPQVGEHTRELLAEVGVDDAEIATLSAAGTISVHDA
jgi:formyl-CoA transferase